MSISSGHTLENLEVLEVGIFGVDIELDAGHGNVHYKRGECPVSHAFFLKLSFFPTRALDRSTRMLTAGGHGHSLNIESKIWHSAALDHATNVSRQSILPYAIPIHRPLRGEGGGWLHHTRFRTVRSW